MSGETINLETLNLAKKLEQLKNSMEEMKKNAELYSKEVTKIIKNEGESITKSVRNFAEINRKEREKRYQQRLVEMKNLQEKIKSIDKKIKDEKIKTGTEEFKESIKNRQEHNKKIKQLELFNFADRLKTNRDFYKKLDDSFKNFGDRTTKIAGKLDSVFGGGFFSAVAKATNSIAGMGNNILKLSLGGAKFLQNWTEGGFKKAFQQTKIGQGIRDTKRTFRQTKIAARKGMAAVKRFIKPKGGDAERMAKMAKASEAKETQEGMFTVSKKGTKASEGMLSTFIAYFKWQKAWEAFKLLFTGAKAIAGAIGSVLGFILPKFLLKPLSSLLSKTKLGEKVLTSKIGQRIFRKVLPKTAGKLATKVATKAGVKTAAKIGLKGIAKALPGIGVGLDALMGAAEGWTRAKGKAADEKFKSLGTRMVSSVLTFGGVLMNTDKVEKPIKKGVDFVNKNVQKGLDFLSKPFDMLGGWFRKKALGISKQADSTMKHLESIKEKTGATALTKSHIEKLKADEKQWAKLSKEEKEILEQRLKGGRRKPTADKTPHIAAAEGFPKKTTQPKKFDDLFGKINRRTNVTVGESGDEYMSVLKKDQYEQLRGMMMQSLPFAFLNPKTLIKGVGKAASATFKLLGGAVKNLFGKKSEDEKRNQDEDAKKYGGELLKGAYKLKDQSVDIDNLPFKNRLMSMINERFKLTKKVTQINSGFRGFEDQVRTYREMPDRAAKPGRSPHGPPNPRAVDINSTDVADLVELGLIRKYGFKYPAARTKSGQPETWHIQAKFGAAFANAPKDFLMKGHAGEGAFVAKTKEFESVFKYFEMGKQLAENVSAGKLDMKFTKDIPGKALQQLQRGPDTVENKLAQQTVKLLSEIKAGLTKEKMAKEGKEQKAEDSKIPQPQPTGQGGSAGYKPKSEVFPTDILMTNMYALMTQFSGGY